MRQPLILASILCSLVFPTSVQATPTKKNLASRSLGLSIRVEGAGWDGASPQAIETVLYSVADELLSRLPKKLATSIVVTHTDSNPIALYDRGVEGEYQVQLHASGASWPLYVYEFAHELCHIMSNYEENVGADTSKYNQWFEETLCETASLFTLKSLAARWETSPPTPELSAQAKSLHRFFDCLISEGHRQLPPDTPLAAWLRENEEALRRNPYLREKNELVANLLLSLFERDPESWSALGYLNLDPGDPRTSLKDYLHHWYDNAPAEHKVFIAGVLDLLLAGAGLDLAADLPAPPAVAVAAAGREDKP